MELLLAHFADPAAKTTGGRKQIGRNYPAGSTRALLPVAVTR